jgi:hypothetical protein
MKLSASITDLYVPNQSHFFTGEFARLRWCILPCEAKDLLVSLQERKIRRRHPPINPPFTPKKFPYRKSHGNENIGSLHGGESKVQNLNYLTPLPDLLPKQSTFTKNPPKNVRPSAPTTNKKWGRPLSGLWSKDKLSKSKSIETLAAIDKNDDVLFNKTQSDNYDTMTMTNDWNKLSAEERMISYLMREYIRTNKERIFNHYN